MSFDTEQNVVRFAQKYAKRKVLALVVLTAFLSTLGGCAAKNQNDLVAYVNAVKARKAGHIAPLPEFKSYESFAYQPNHLRDPFAPSKAEASIVAGSGKGGPRPNETRNKEPLEAFPLDALKYVGLLEKDKTVWAIITAPDGFVYRIQVGNYMGQNYGRVTRITDGQIDIRELVPNGMGGWVERNAKLALTE